MLPVDYMVELTIDRKGDDGENLRHEVPVLVDANNFEFDLGVAPRGLLPVEDRHAVPVTMKGEITASRLHPDRDGPEMVIRQPILIHALQNVRSIKDDFGRLWGGRDREWWWCATKSSMMSWP